jgi:hypothetical protein
MQIHHLSLPCNLQHHLVLNKEILVGLVQILGQAYLFDKVYIMV